MERFLAKQKKCHLESGLNKRDEDAHENFVTQMPVVPRSKPRPGVFSLPLSLSLVVLLVLLPFGRLFCHLRSARTAAGMPVGRATPPPPVALLAPPPRSPAAAADANAATTAAATGET